MAVVVPYLVKYTQPDVCHEGAVFHCGLEHDLDHLIVGHRDKIFFHDAEVFKCVLRMLWISNISYDICSKQGEGRERE